LLSLAAFSVAEKPPDAEPAPAVSMVPVEANEVSLSGVFFERENMNAGKGMSTSLTHYFTGHFGFTADADILKSDFALFREYGYRAGPTVTFLRSYRVQPFAHFLMGYSRFKEINTGPQRPYVSGFSYMPGGGADVRLIGSVFARVAIDGEVDPDTGPSVTHVMRLSFGLNYKFGRQRSY